MPNVTPTKELLAELRERGYVACHGSRVHMLHARHVETLDAWNQFVADLEPVIKHEMAHSLSQTLLDQGLIRFTRTTDRFPPGVLIAAKLCVINLKQPKDTNARADT